MMNFRYIFPPRPENKIPVSSLEMFEKTNSYLAQPKLNGELMEIYMDENEMYLWNRHKKPCCCKMERDELRKLYRGNGLMVLCGEYMGISKKDEKGKVWNHKFVIFDILVYNGKHLLGTTFFERFQLLQSLYPNNLVKPLIHRISENCFRVESILIDFTKTFSEITKFDMYEGLVLKKYINVMGLEDGRSESNNVRSQIKCRKPTKNYNN